MVYSDPHRGPLTGVEGIQNVWLGRKVEDPEQAALIIREFSGSSHSPCHLRLWSLIYLLTRNKISLGDGRQLKEIPGLSRLR